MIYDFSVKNQIKIGVIGAGYWGLNLVRNFSKIGVLKSVSDLEKKRKKEVVKISKNIHFTTNYKDILDDEAIIAVVIATPAKTHFKFAKEVIKSKKHIFVEKPLCLNYKDGKNLLELANKANKKIMVGHLMLYHPAYIKMKEKINEGLIGKIRYIYSNRLSLGKLRKEEDVLWSFAPHDISMILDLVKEKLLKVDSFGASYLKKKIKDTTVTFLKFSNNIKAHIFVSWLHPYKDQRIIVIGEKGMLVFADVLENKNKLQFFNHNIGWKGSFPEISKAKGKSISFNYSVEPLYAECKAFVNWLTIDKTVPSDAEEGLRVLKVLEDAKNKLKENK